MGIKDLKSYLGIDETNGVGLDRRKVQKQSPHLVWVDNKEISKVKYSGFALYRFWNGVEEWTPRDFYPSNKEKTFNAGWSKDGFYVLAESKHKIVESLKLIFEALNTNNACIWLGGGGIFQNSGLCIGIVDKMPKSIFDNWAVGDNDQAALKAEFDATGIEKILRDAKKDWFYLGPKRDRDGKMIIWLNPREQNIHNSGYFTVEQLKLWAKDKGPVMMTDKQKRERER